MHLQQIMLQISFELYERQTQITSILLMIVLVCSSIIGIGRINNPQFFLLVGKGFFKLKSQEKSFSEGTRLSGGASFALILNFFISLTLCSFLLFFSNSNLWFSLLAALIVSFSYILIQQVGFRITSFFSGQSEITENISLVTNQVWFLGGIVFLLIALFWVLNMRFKDVFGIIFLVVVFIITMFRFIKGFLIAYRSRIRWYYIFLYLCTLEILPVFILFRLFQMYLMEKF